MKYEDLFPKPKKQTLSLEQRTQNALRSVWRAGVKLDVIINDILSVVPEADIDTVEVMVRKHNSQLANQRNEAQEMLKPFYQAARNVLK